MIPIGNTTHFRNLPIERVRNFKLLGVHLDETLSFKVHIDYIISKVSVGLKMLYRTRQYLDDRNTLLCVYHSLIKQYFDYCSTVWGDCSKSLQDKLQKLQNRAGRIITKSDYSVLSFDIREKLHWLTLDQHRINAKSTMMCKILNGLGADCLSEMFSFSGQCYKYILRNKPKFTDTQNQYLKRAFAYSGAAAWNN